MVLTIVKIETALFFLLFSYGYSSAVTKYNILIHKYSVKVCKKKKKTDYLIGRIDCKSMILLPVSTNDRKKEL